MYNNSKQINDPIHGYMEFDDWAVEVIDTPEFQRLRNLKQLGSTYYVFPGASHNRFEHCLGVAHLSNKLLKKFYQTQPELESKSNKSDLKCVTLAGLCHDLGHGPFSHVFDNHVIHRLGLKNSWKHEKGSVMMFNHLIDQHGINLDSEDVKFIESLIIGTKPKKDDLKYSGRKFLFDIVSNETNSIDVDKFDYLERDCYNIGLKSSYDSSQLMKFSHVIDDEICYHQKESHNVYELFHTRYSLHKNVYKHPIGIAIEHMFADALIKANEVFNFSEIINDPERYLELDDTIFNRIEFSVDPRLEESKKILKRIRNRQLYKLVDELLIHDSKEKDKITEELIASNQSDFLKEDIIVHSHTIDYSKEDEDPVNSVNFYNKHNYKKAFKIDSNEISYLTPGQFREKVIRIYTREPKHLGKIQKAFRDLIKKYYNILPNINSIDYNSGHVNKVNTKLNVAISNGLTLPDGFTYSHSSSEKRRRTN